jgi:P27 family predicted phage terminase small subunit
MAEKLPVPRAPSGLDDAGRRLWRSIWRGLEDGWELDEREVELLQRACTSADHIAELEETVAEEGVTAYGAAGQVVAHPALVELRQQKLVLQRLLGALALPEEANVTSAASKRAQAAANKRWHGKNRTARRRAAGGGS